ncbi:hypothetical protein EDD16DRAFT_1515397 [Pisolithus croceorrhizus]|nr:hypothetical protein EDD16DRAFT_1515397 [Pisolithus croceorrhizus]
MPLGRGCQAEVKGGNTMDPPVPQSHSVASSRHLTQVTAGQGGHVIQLEKAGLAIEAHRWLPKPLHQIPGDEPVNDMAPAPHQMKKATCKVTRESKNGGLSAPPNNVPGDQSSQLPASQDEQPTMPEGSRFGLQLENPAVPTYVGSQTIDVYEQGSTNNSMLSHTKKVTQLNPTAHPQSSWSHAAIQTPQGLPMAAPSHPPAYKVLPQNQPSLSPSVEDVQHQPSSPLSLLSSPKVLQSSNNENDHLEDRVFHLTDLDEWAEDHIDQSDYDVNYEDSDTGKRKEDEVPSFETVMPARQQNSSQILIPLAHVSSRQLGSLFLNHHLVLLPSLLSCSSLPMLGPVIPVSCLLLQGVVLSHVLQSIPISHSIKVLSPPDHVYLLKHPYHILPPRTCELMIQCHHSLPHLHPNQTWVQVLQMVTGMTIVKLIVQEMKENCHHSPSPSYLSTISLPKLKKQHTSTEDKLGLKEDNSEVMSGTPKLTGQGHCTKYSKNPKGLDVIGQCSEILFEVLAHYEEKNLKVKAGYYPQYKLDMAKLQDQEGCYLNYSSSVSALPPPSATTEADCHRAIKIRAEEILKGGENNNSVKSLCQFTEFQQYVPYKVLLLVAAIMHRFIPKESKLSSEALNSAFNTMVPKLEAVLFHAYHGPKLNAMLEEWVNLSMTGYTPIGRPAVAQDSNHFDIILD